MAVPRFGFAQSGLTTRPEASKEDPCSSYVRERGPWATVICYGLSKRHVVIGPFAATAARAWICGCLLLALRLPAVPALPGARRGMHERDILELLCEKPAVVLCKSLL